MVQLDPDLLRILICPSCHGDVEHKERRHVIICTRCGLQYPVRDGIPVMLVDEATPGRGSPAAGAGRDGPGQGSRDAEGSSGS